MIVRHFLGWVRTAPAAERAEATRALARAWLFSDMSSDDFAATEGALLLLLDDPSPLVRGAAVWALSQLLPRQRFAELRKKHTDTDPTVRDEWVSALA